MARLRKLLIACHRWLGTAFCLLFAMWFLSGFAMMYWPYPVVGDSDRIAHSAPLDPAGLAISPEKAFALADADRPPGAVRLSLLDGRPAYRFRFGGDQVVVFDDNGQVLENVPQAL